MRPLNTLVTIAFAAFMVVGLGACGKKSNSSSATTAAAPGSACTFNFATNTYTNIHGQVCNPSATNITCPANGQYTNQYGQFSPCTPGQYVNNGGTYGYPGQYPYTPYPNQQTSGCDQYYYYYGVQYVPVNLSGQIQCVRIDVLNQYSTGTPYQNNYDYYYAYPPYSYGGSGWCGKQVAVNFSGFSGALCF